MSNVPAIKDKGPLLAHSKAPEAINRLIDMELWARSIVYGEKYKEVDPDFISRMLAFQVITATSAEEAFKQAGVKGVQEIVPNKPNATTGPIEITDLYVTESDYDQGNTSYVIMTWIDLTTGEEVRGTTGATNIQATLIALLANGVWPIRCQIKRGDSKDKGGKYLLFMLPAD